MSEATAKSDPAARAARLPCWSGAVAPVPITGGITNVNFMVEDGGTRFFVRVGEDIPVHGVLRFNELAAARAAAAAGISPEVIYSEPGILVTRFIEGRAWTPQEARDPANLPRIVDLIRRCHREVPLHLRGPVVMFWVFHVVRDYAATLCAADSRHVAVLPDLL
ncbi:MAG: choline kinase, partial [Alphaproteobacteria bacterium]